MGVFKVARRELAFNMSSIRTRQIIACVAAAVLASVAGNFLVAAAIGNEVVVCARNSTGKLYYPQNQQCAPSSESSIILNPTGATGAAGAKGATGATGPTGATGADGGYPSTLTVKEITVTHTVQASDAGTLLLANNSGAVIFLPTNSAVPIAIGTRINLANRKSFLTVTPNSGVTINLLTSAISFDSGNYQYGTLIKLSADDWAFMSSPDEFP